MTSKKNLFVLAFSLFLAAFGTLNAQTQGKLPQFTVTVPSGTVTALSAEDAAKLNLRHESDLTAQEFNGAITNDPNFAVVWTAPNCQLGTGTGFFVPRGTCLTSTPPAWVSVNFGCTQTIWWPTSDCTGGALVLSGFPQNACIQTNPIFVFGSIACI